jgi:hypothetical protein
MRCLVCRSTFKTEDDLYRHVGETTHSALIPALVPIEEAA